MKIKKLCFAVFTTLLTATAVAEIEEGSPKTGMFMYVNSVNVGDEVISLPVLMAGELICTTYITGYKVEDGKVDASFAQYCDPVIEEAIKLEDGSDATVITSISASTFYFNYQLAKHQFEENESTEDFEKIHHVKLSPSVYASFSKSFDDKINKFISERDDAISKMEQ